MLAECKTDLVDNLDFVDFRNSVSYTGIILAALDFNIIFSCEYICWYWYRSFYFMQERLDVKSYAWFEA